MTVLFGLNEILNAPLARLLNSSDSLSSQPLPFCGQNPSCPRGDTNCNFLRGKCISDEGDGGGTGWYTIAIESVNTVIDSFIHDPALYSIKNYLSNSNESSLVIRAYDAWKHVQINSTTIPLYYELIPALVGKYDMLSSQFGTGVVVDASVDNLMQQIISHHRSFGDNTFQSHLDYLQSKVSQYQMMSVEQVSASMYPTTNDDPILQ